MRPIVWLVMGLLLLAGCGGGGGGNVTQTNTNVPPKSTTVSLKVNWGPRTRVVNAPSSALSGTLVIKGAKPGGGDFTFPLDRPDGLNVETTKTYTTTAVLTGTWPATVTFYANTDGQGAVVGAVTKQVTITTTTTDLGEFVTAGTIAAILVPTPQTFTIGQTGDVVFTAVDAQGNAIAVTPGSALWTVTPIQSYLVGDPAQIDTGGHVIPTYAADYHVSVNVDGKVNGQGVVTGQATVHIVSTVKYDMVSLGTLPGDQSSRPLALNAAGDAAGYSGSPYAGIGAVEHAVFWRSGSAILGLGALPGDTYSVALGVNAGDQVVGVSSSQYIAFTGFEATPLVDITLTYGEVTPTSASHAFLWTPNAGMQAIPLTVANAINDAGQVVGMANNHAALWTVGGGVVDLGILPGFSVSTAIAINNAGQVLCQASAFNNTSGEDIRCFLWTQSGGIKDLGSAGSGMSVARALSSNGTVAGTEYLPSYNNVLYTWTASGGYKLLPLGEPPVRAIIPYPGGINASGVIVTQDSNLIVNGLWVGIGWYVAPPVPNIDQLRGINDKGQIIAARLDTDEAILLNPR